MIQRPLDDIAEADVMALIANKVSEGRDLEFKRDLPGGRDDDVKEFLADVTSLANTQGGDLVFGIEDDRGEAVAVPGVSMPDVDATLLRLENLLRDAVQPRLQTRMRWVGMSGGTGVLVIRVPASLSAPHRIVFKNSNRFFHRNSRGKAEMDTHELRQAFTGTEELLGRLRDLHTRAVTMIQKGDFPFKLSDGPRAVLSVVPLSIFREPRDLGLSHETALWPARHGNIDWIPTLEGFLVFNVGGETTSSFALTHRTGYADASWAIGRVREDGQPLVWPFPLEAVLTETVQSAITKLSAQGVDGPWMVALTLLGVRGFMLSYGEGGYQMGSKTAWRDTLALPPVVMDRFSEPALIPLARMVFYGFGENRPQNRSLGQVTD